MDSVVEASLVTPYDQRFYDTIVPGSLQSARRIVPLVLELVCPRSVVDVGCGQGTWLSVFAEHGVNDLCGLDGDWIDRSALQIPEACFVPVDLKNGFRLQREFDLATCLEVAEHLPEDSARTLVESLTSLAPAVLFSAAVPLQGGLNHLNEQWPDYWARLFESRGYIAVDCIRSRVWQDPGVEWWYAQNTILYVTAGLLSDRPILRAESQSTRSSQLSIVHPRHYLHVAMRCSHLTARLDPHNMSLRRQLALLPVVLRSAFARRLHSLTTR